MEQDSLRPQHSDLNYSFSLEEHDGESEGFVPVHGTAFAQRDAENSELKLQLQQAHEQLRKRDEEIVGLTTQLEEQRGGAHRHDAQSLQPFADAQQRIAELEERTAELENCLEQRDAELVSLATERQELNLQLHQVQAIHEKLAKAHFLQQQHNAKLEERQSEVHRNEELQQYLQQRETALSERKEECANLQSKLDQACQQLCGYDTEFAEMQQRAAQRSEDLSECTVKLQHRDVLLQQKSMECVELRSHVDQISSELRGKGEVLAQRAAQLQRQELSLQQESAECKQLNSRMEHASSELRSRDEILAQLKPELRRISDELCNMRLLPQHGESPEPKLQNDRMSQQMKSVVEKGLADYSEFIKHLADSSAGPTLPQKFDLAGAEILDLGTYGYVLLCRESSSKSKVVVRVHSQRWVDVVVKEWAHGAETGSHPHIVASSQVVMHRDANNELERCIRAGYEGGALQGRQPKCFPSFYFCIVSEYMDRGTAQDLIDRHLVTPESVAAVACQVAKALAFMHKKQRTHNDVKPGNILLRQSSTGNGLVVKLADIGLSRQSAEQKHDCDLLGYTVWCMCLGRSFGHCPGKNLQAGAIAEFQAAAQEAADSRELWGTLLDVVRGLWHGSLSSFDVADMKALQGYSVQVPHLALAQLEMAAKGTATTRSIMALERFNGKKQEAQSEAMGNTYTGGYPRQGDRGDRLESIKT